MSFGAKPATIGMNSVCRRSSRIAGIGEEESRLSREVLPGAKIGIAPRELVALLFAG